MLMKKFGFLLLALVLMGQGCASGGGDLPEGFTERPKGPDVTSEFDASSESNFDALAAEYIEYMQENELTFATAFTFNDFVTFAAASGVDSHGSAIFLDENSADYEKWFVLYSNGKDGFPNTADDLYKGYTY